MFEGIVGVLLECWLTDLIVRSLLTIDEKTIENMSDDIHIHNNWPRGPPVLITFGGFCASFIAFVFVLGPFCPYVFTFRPGVWTSIDSLLSDFYFDSTMMIMITLRNKK